MKKNSVAKRGVAVRSLENPSVESLGPLLKRRGWAEQMERDAVESLADMIFLADLADLGVLTKLNFHVLLDAHRHATGAAYDDGLARKGPLGNRRPDEEPPDPATPGEKFWTPPGGLPERERTMAFEQHSARIEAASGRVRTLRRSLLASPTAVIPVQQARRLLACPALRFLTWREVRERHGRDAARWPLTKLREKRAHRPHARLIQLLGESGRLESVQVERGSLLDSLYGHARPIGRSHGWSDAEAALWLLTGEVPARAAISVWTSEHWTADDVPVHAEIGVKAAPHASADAVRAVFVEQQERILGHPLRRPITTPRLALVEFVAEQIVRQGRVPDPGKLMKLWNAKWKGRPDWQYEYPSTMMGHYRESAPRVFLLSEDFPPTATLDTLERVLAEPEEGLPIFPEDSTPGQKARATAPGRGRTRKSRRARARRRR